MYRFSGGTKLAVFTYHGCVLELAGNVANPYVASETPMNQYFEVAEQLDKERYQTMIKIINTAESKLICNEKIH